MKKMSFGKWWSEFTNFQRRQQDMKNVSGMNELNE